MTGKRSVREFICETSLHSRSTKRIKSVILTGFVLRGRILIGDGDPFDSAFFRFFGRDTFEARSGPLRGDSSFLQMPHFQKETQQKNRGSSRGTQELFETARKSSGSQRGFYWTVFLWLTTVSGLLCRGGKRSFLLRPFAENN